MLKETNMQIFTRILSPLYFVFNQASVINTGKKIEIAVIGKNDGKRRISVNRKTL